MNTSTQYLTKALRDIARKVDEIHAALNADVRVPDRLITVREASKILNRSEYCLRIDINKGLIPAKKVGRGWLLSYNQVQAMVNAPNSLTPEKD